MLLVSVFSKAGALGAPHVGERTEKQLIGSGRPAKISDNAPISTTANNRRRGVS